MAGIIAEKDITGGSQKRRSKVAYVRKKEKSNLEMTSDWLDDRTIGAHAHAMVSNRTAREWLLYENSQAMEPSVDSPNYFIQKFNITLYVNSQAMGSFTRRAGLIFV